MTQINQHHALQEAHVRITCDGNAIHLDGLPMGPDTFTLPPYYQSGLYAIFHLLEAKVPAMLCISILGIWRETPETKDAPFFAFDLWIQNDQREGFYLPMESAASLFSRNGIPYYHQPQI